MRFFAALRMTAEELRMTDYEWVKLKELLFSPPLFS
jgi:hypothetical protein